MKNQQYLKERILRNQIKKRERFFEKIQNKNSNYIKPTKKIIPYIQGSLYIKSHKQCTLLEKHTKFETPFLKSQFLILYKSSEGSFQRIKKYQKNRKREKTLYSKILKGYNDYEKLKKNDPKMLISYIKGEIKNDPITYHNLVKIINRIKEFHPEKYKNIVLSLDYIIKERCCS